MVYYDQCYWDSRLRQCIASCKTKKEMPFTGQSAQMLHERLTPCVSPMDKSKPTVGSSTSTRKTTYIHQLQSRVLRGRFPYQTTIVFFFPVCCLQNVWLFVESISVDPTLPWRQLDLFSRAIQRVKYYRKVTKYRFRGCCVLRKLCGKKSVDTLISCLQL